MSETITLTAIGAQTVCVYGKQATMSLLAYNISDTNNVYELWRVSEAYALDDGVYYRTGRARSDDYIWSPDGTLQDLRWYMYDNAHALRDTKRARTDLIWL